MRFVLSVLAQLGITWANTDTVSRGEVPRGMAGGVLTFEEGQGQSTL